MIYYAGLLPLIVSVWGAALPSQNFGNNAKDSDFSNYTPVRVECPKGQKWIRHANGLSTEEATWVRGRKLEVLQGLKPYLGRLNLSDFDSTEYFDRLRQESDAVPTISFAISGGAWASSLTGTGVLRALDARFSPAVEQ